ncbi:hypothetical protein Arnit_1543 [Arcobacter nitrofigilis DSM 7299]|uniref:MFS transporter n=1 Tax=Arcobacter nitrofigilis (strain ATCC 33309 / DSM 7299 / CCUG 15893 / LMG 7604 / NCTC 12251 / CI) TaxID=572480 RepID=D5V631_ARCNC|nr:hypothetical protein [Arcobacter nitrofigilis]ADG93198.1 hypothetical protein Arnit_1543 [Arcobacter nitrofigilis DSM 7299]
MAFKNYALIFKEIKSSNFLKVQSLTLFLTTYIDWTLIPFVTKLEGTYLPVFMISFYMLVGALDGFIQPLFKNIKIYHIYMFAIILDVIQIFSYMVFSSSILIFTYVILTIFTIQGITFEIARIHTVDFMQEEKVHLKDYLMIRSFMISGAIVAGSLSAMLFDYFSSDLKILLGYLSVLGILGIMLQIKLYNKFKRRIYGAKIKIKKDKKELFEKFRL